MKPVNTKKQAQVSLQKPGEDGMKKAWREEAKKKAWAPKKEQEIRRKKATQIVIIVA